MARICFEKLNSCMHIICYARDDSAQFWCMSLKVRKAQVSQILLLYDFFPSVKQRIEKFFNSEFIINGALGPKLGNKDFGVPDFREGDLLLVCYEFPRRICYR